MAIPELTSRQRLPIVLAALTAGVLALCEQAGADEATIDNLNTALEALGVEPEGEGSL